MAKGTGLVIAGGALVAFLLMSRVGQGDDESPPPVIPGPPPPPGPGGGGYTYPAGFDMRHAIIQAGAAHRGMPIWLAPATAFAESSMRWPPPPPNECGGDIGCTYYPMGIKSGTIATALGQGADFRRNRAPYDAIGFDLPRQIVAAAAYLSSLWANASMIARSEEVAAHLVRVAWQSGTMPNSERLPEWYSLPNRDCGGKSCAQHWAESVKAAGGPDIRLAAGGMAGAGMGYPYSQPYRRLRRVA